MLLSYLHFLPIPKIRKDIALDDRPDALYSGFCKLLYIVYNATSSLYILYSLFVCK